MRRCGNIWGKCLKLMQYGHPSHSPWASPVILVHKKHGKLWFCIDLRKLNACTIKDSYSLPRIEDTLDSLNGAILFSALHLKSGYCQVKMDEESKPMMALTVGWLGFHKCDHVLFGLVNDPATFQRLKETCLGDLQLNWCLIYLDNIIMFFENAKRSPSPVENSFPQTQGGRTKIETQYAWI